MKKMILSLLVAGACTSMVSANTLVYLNFDEAADATAANGDSYTAGSSEVLLEEVLGTTTVTYRSYDSGSGPSIGALPGGLSGTSQGGKALLVDGTAGQEMGITIETANQVSPGDLTIEAIWYTTDPTGGSNTVGIQSIIGNEWPAGDVAQFFIRTVGANRMDWWTDRGDSNGENVQDTTTGVVQANTLYHDVLVFDYNDGDPANSQITGYRDGVQVGTSVYDASGITSAYFGTGFNNGTPGNEVNAIAIGMNLAAPVNGSDDRGLIGGVDAAAVSRAALGTSDFVLPSGNVVSPPLSVSNWELY